MEKQKNSLFQHSMIYGLYLGLALIVYSLLLYLASLNLNTAMNSLIYLIIAVGLFVSVKHYRDGANEGLLTFGEGMKLGIMISVFAGFLSGVFSYVLHLIDPTMIDQLIQFQQQAMLEKGVPEDQVAQMEDMMRKMSNPLIMVISSLFSMALIGSIISLVVSAILKKKPANPFDAAVKEVE